MSANNLDHHIKEKLQNRTFQPSTSAWERLSTQLDEQPKQKKRGWFFYIGAAASILLLISLGFLFLNDKEPVKPLEIIVDNSLDIDTVDKKIDQLINEIPIEKALVKIDEVEGKQVLKKKVIAKKVKQPDFNKKNRLVGENSIQPSKKDEIVIAKADEIKRDNISTEIEKSKKIKILKQDPNSKIKINSDDLLFAVTHSSKEVKEYYAKYNVNREDILNTIKSELKKSNIKVNPNSILAEVERTIDDDVFQNNFMKSLKRKVLGIATAIAGRNH